MLSLKYKKLNYEFEYPFETNKGVKTHQPSLVIALGMGRLLGLGEATEISYHPETIEGMIALLEEKRNVIERYSIIDPERYWHFLHHLIPNQHFLISALDIAGWDLFGKMSRKPVYELLGLTWDQSQIPLTDYTLGISNLDEIKDKVIKHPAAIYKLKVNQAADIEKIVALRSCTDAKIRLDANEGWSFEDAKSIIKTLNDLNIELIEQPFDKDDLDSVMRLKELTHIPIIADEACQSEHDLEKLIPVYDGINVKLSKCGGITPAVKLIKAAKKADMKVMLGCMSEGNIGCTALAHLLPLADYADIDGPLILKDDFAKGLIYEQGIITLPANRTGLCIS